ncbi:sulfite exporter TauE/SafE family protein [Salidesulfovibrio brasiliensis]
MLEYTLMFLIIMSAGFVQGLTGFGSVLLSLPLLSLMLDIKTVIPLISLFALCINASVCYSVRRSLSAKRLALLLVATLPGLPVGAWALKHVVQHYLALFLGLTIILFIGYQFLFKPKRIEWRRRWIALTGLLAGFLGGSIGANGPPIIIYATTQPWPKDEIKATLAGYFFLAGLGISTSHYSFGMITGEVTSLFLRLLPALGIGIILGVRSYGRLSDSFFRRFAMFLVLALGFMITAKALIKII